MGEPANTSADKDRILVTGADGQLGKEFRQLAVSYPQYEFIFLSKNDLSIHHPESVKEFFSEYHPQHCINCAAYTAVDKAESEKEMAFLVNGEAVGGLAAVCKEYNCSFLHISTDYVFDGAASVPYKEDSPANPQGVYGASKLEGEKQALRFNPGSIIIRTSWVYSEFGKNFVKTMMKLMNERSEISVVNDQYGSPTYAADLARAIIHIIANLSVHHSLPATAGIYHYSNEGAISWYDFVVAIKEMTGAACKVNPIPTSQYPTPAKRPAYSVMDKERIQQIFGVKLVDWKVSLAHCIQRLEKKGE